MLNIVFNGLKYLLEGLAVSMAVYIISKGKMTYKDTAVLALTVSAVFLVLDVWAPLTGQSARHGSGFGMGYNLVGGSVEKAGLDENNTSQSAGEVTRPYTLVQSDYGHALKAGFNESAEAYNSADLNTLAGF